MSHKISELISNVLTLNSTLTFDNDQVKAAISGTEGLDNFTQKKRTFLAVVKLTELQEIKALIDLANLCASDQDLAFTLYPISTGKNWGYGSSQPSGIEKKYRFVRFGAIK
jgi:4-cresol dehydrogenase (hydroxylating)